MGEAWRGKQEPKSLGPLYIDPTNEQAVLRNVPEPGSRIVAWLSSPVTTPGGNTNGPGSISEEPSTQDVTDNADHLPADIEGVLDASYRGP